MGGADQRCAAARDAQCSSVGIHAARWSRRSAHRASRPHARRDAERGARASGGGVVTAVLSRDDLLDILDTVKDPEVPVLSVVELGIVRDAVATPDGVIVTVTPTYSGCPAMREIEEEIR